MARIGAIVRLLMLAAGLVPFTSTRQAVAFLSTQPTSSAAPTAPASVPEEEETERGKEPAGKEKARKFAPPSRPASPPRRPVYSRPSACHAALAIASPALIDPFRNGLGCPFRC